MWIKSYSVVTKEVTAAQMWKLFSDVNNWHTWDEGIEWAKMEGEFAVGNQFMMRPKGGPNVKIKLVETTPNKSFTDFTQFPLAKMYGTHTFELTSEGLKITTTMKMQGILGFLWIKIVAQKIVDSLPTEMQAQIQAAKLL